ncbi:MAG: tripartite tricarboxylate transporter substrate binding protein [Spirochaetales bacterium]|jgi:putative tricarboxylic transport membrane protein|nr:tripartite tricarboxylate transporter substrate binding protein [Spirochaetales bacterium]
MKKFFLLSLGMFFLCGLSLSFAGGGAEGGSSSSAQGGPWVPSKDIEYIIPASPGGGSDLWARAMSNAIAANKLSTVTWVPTNRAGGASAVGYNYMLSQKGNEHVILAAHSGAMVSSYVAGWAQKFEDMVEMICILAFDDVTLCTLTTGPYKDIKSLLKAAQDKPGTLKFGSDQRLNSSQYAYEMLKKYAKADFNYVQYDSSGDAATALLGGHVDVAILNPAECLGQVNAGTFTPVATFATERLSGKFSGAPTFAEIGYPQIVLREFRGISATLGMSEGAKKYYEEMGRKVQQTPEFKKYLETNSFTPVFMGLGESQKYASAEMQKIADLFKEVTKK